MYLGNYEGVLKQLRKEFIKNFTFFEKDSIRFVEYWTCANTLPKQEGIRKRLAMILRRFSNN